MNPQSKSLQTLEAEEIGDELTNREECGNAVSVEDVLLRAINPRSQREVRVLQKPPENKWRKYAERVAEQHLMGPC